MLFSRFIWLNNLQSRILKLKTGVRGYCGHNYVSHESSRSILFSNVYNNTLNIMLLPLVQKHFESNETATVESLKVQKERSESVFECENDFVPTLYRLFVFNERVIFVVFNRIEQWSRKPGTVFGSWLRFRYFSSTFTFMTYRRPIAMWYWTKLHDNIGLLRGNGQTLKRAL